MKKLLLAAIVLPGLVNAGSEPIASPFPQAKKGINILPLAKIDMPMKKETMRQLKTLSVNGYNKTTSTDQSVTFLFNVAKLSAKERSRYDNIQNPLDTHLKSELSKLSLSFKFSGIPGIKKKNVLGYAAAGGYTHEKGWDGVAEFVQGGNLGICSYTTFAIESVIIYKEALEYLVNNKPSDKSIQGNWEKGFLYHVNWYTDTRRHALECASTKLKPENLKEMVRIANEIDKTVD